MRIIQDNEEFMNANHNKYGLERVLSENYAFIAESTSLDLMDPDKRCQVYQVGQPLISVFHGIGMQKSMNNQSVHPQESSVLLIFRLSLQDESQPSNSTVLC